MGRFTPKSEEELTRLLPDGVYDAFVCRAVDKQTKTTGDDMIEIGLEIYGPDNSKYFVNDNLIFTESAVWKLHSFCKAAGILERYEQGEVYAQDCMGLNVKVKIGTEPAKDGFKPKNKVKSYIAPRAAKAPSDDRPPPRNRPVTENAAGEADIPF